VNKLVVRENSGQCPQACDTDDAATATAVVATLAAADEETSDEEDEVTIKHREETKARLRELGEPATLFGEGDAERLARLRLCELGTDQDVLASGSTNVMQLLNRQAQSGTLERDEEDEMSMALVVASKLGIQVDSGKADMESSTVAAGADGGPDEDMEVQVVLAWIRETLREWEAVLLARAKEEHNSAAFKSEKAQFRQSKQYLRPLRRALREGEINRSIVCGLAHIADCCRKREYKSAKESYMKLAIGDSAWPMGVTFVTFHDRPNRHTIGEQTVAHILDDETTRKYIQMIKRLLTFAETRWPVEPSRAA